MFAGAALLVVACNGAGAGQRIDAPARRNATLSLRSALITVAPEEATPVIASCRGGALCRELELPRGGANADAIEEANEDCTHRGGTIDTTPCARAGVVASCTLSGVAGPIRVFTYPQQDANEQQEAVSKMDDLCSAMDGTFELRAR